MKRKLACMGFPYLLGLLAFSLGWGRYSLVFACLVLLWAAAFVVAKKYYRTYTAVMAFCFFIGVAYGTFYTYTNYNNILKYDGKTVEIVGYVQDYSYISYDQGILTVKGIINGDATTQISFFVPHEDYEYYEQIKIKGSVVKITDDVDFQSEQYYRPKGVFLKGKSVESVERTGRCTNVAFREIKKYRDYLFSKINNIVGGEEGGFLGAMLCGDKSEMSYETKLKLYRVGIGHIFSVSGTHLVIISGFFGFLFKLLSLGKRASFLFMELVVWSFVVFSGLSPSVVRAAIMITVIMLSGQFNRKGDCLNSLGLCCILLTIRNPYIVRNTSFLLSVTGVFALGVVAPKVTSSIGVKGIGGKLVKSIAAMFVLLFTAMPVTMLFFDEVSLVAPITNIVLLPVCTLALSVTVIVAVTGGVSFIAVPVLRFAGILIKAVLYVSDKLSSFRYSYITLSSKELKIIAACICFMIVLVIIALKSFRNKAVCSLTAYSALILAFNVTGIASKNEIHMVIIPDNSASQTVIYKGNQCVILDNGAKGEHNKGVQRLVEKQGITEISAVAITEEMYFSSDNYQYNLYPIADRIFADFEDFECHELFFNDKIFVFENMEISRVENGFSIDIESENIIISKNEFSLGGVKYSFAESDYPWELVYSDNKFEVRRFDYGFDEQ